MSGHILPVRTYLKVFFALLILTAVTTAIAYVDLGFLNDTVAMTIALTKTFLVVTIFMHLKWSSKLVKFSLASGVVFLLLLFAFVLADYMTRGNVPAW